MGEVSEPNGDDDEGIAINSLADRTTRMVMSLLFLLFVLVLEIDVVGLVQCTSPFVGVEELQEAVTKMASGSYDCVFSVTRSHALRWHRDSTNGKAASTVP